MQAAQCRLNARIYAIKTIEKAKAHRAGAVRSLFSCVLIQTLSLAIERHLHIAAAQSFDPALAPKLFLAFQTEDEYHLVMDMCTCSSP